MAVRDILLFLHGGAANDAAVELAMGWAQALGAAVTGCCLCADPEPSIADCYADLADHVTAVETGLSSDPEMNWRVSSLDRYRLVSNSDAHSPAALARARRQGQSRKVIAHEGLLNRLLAAA